MHSNMNIKFGIYEHLQTLTTSSFMFHTIWAESATSTKLQHSHHSIWHHILNTTVFTPLAPNARYTCHAVKCSDHQTSGVENSIHWPSTCNSYFNSSLLHITPGVQFCNQRLNIDHCLARLFVLHALSSLVVISHSKIMNPEQRCVNMLHATEQYVHCTVQIWHRNDILTAFWYLTLFFNSGSFF
jgi:hypothetical protein